MAAFTAMGYDVSIPLTESAAYDLVVDDGQQLYLIKACLAERRSVTLRDR
ncbi:MAG: group I intron-associated PD-(D/E)XK endonuclease [Gaiellaceae bacterium]